MVTDFSVQKNYALISFLLLAVMVECYLRQVYSNFDYAPDVPGSGLRRCDLTRSCHARCFAHRRSI